MCPLQTCPWISAFKPVLIPLIMTSILAVFCSKNKTNEFQAELVKPNVVLHMLVLPYICVTVDVLFHFCEELAYTVCILNVDITSEFLSMLCL
jgi:hypothetical protein